MVPFYSVRSVKKNYRISNIFEFLVFKYTQTSIWRTIMSGPFYSLYCEIYYIMNLLIIKGAGICSFQFIIWDSLYRSFGVVRNWDRKLHQQPNDDGRYLSRHKQTVFIYSRCLNETFPWCINPNEKSNECKSHFIILVTYQQRNQGNVPLRHQPNLKNSSIYFSIKY